MKIFSVQPQKYLVFRQELVDEESLLKTSNFVLKTMYCFFE